MRRHKRFYFEQTSEQPNLYRIVMIARRPKHKSKIRRIIWLAWHYKWGK